METKQEEKEIKKEEIKTESIFQKKWMHSLIIVVIIFGGLFTFLFWQGGKNVVSIENSELEAPIINLSSTTPGTLNALYVKEGDRVGDNTPVALVGSQTISTKDGGIVTSATNVLGAYFAPGQTIVSIVKDSEMKVVGQIEETKGLKNIKTGDKATFTVDAFPGKTFDGLVDQISATSSDTGIVFSISDKRPTKKFNVEVKFDVAKYPELKSGMSAKIKVYTN